MTGERNARIAALCAGVMALLVVWWVWGAWSPRPIIADEQSYVLQSRIFASGHWTAPPPPIPAFFEQSVVLTSPRVASKMPPGHALLLAIGTFLGATAAIPLVFTALTGALLFLLVRRVTNQWVALFTVIVWIGDPINLRFRPGYYSEVTTQLLWLASFWALLEWRSSRARDWLLALAACIGWGAVTRPLTMLAFAVPVSVVVLRDVIRLRAWRDLGLAIVLGVVILAVLPLWSAMTTGDWRTTPLTLYTRDYLPFDKLGFGIDTTRPAKPLNAVNTFTYAEFYREHAMHTVAGLPRTIWDRLRAIGVAEWSGPRIALVPFAIAGIVVATPVVGFAALCAASLFIAYLAYGHFAGWTLYYFEAMPVLALITALGIHRFIALTTGKRRAMIALFAAMVTGTTSLAAYEAARWRADHATNSAWYRDFDAAIAKLPQNPTVIFVHYTPTLQPHPMIVRNSPTLADDPLWIVNDLGPRDAELMAYAAGRVPIAFYEDGRRFVLERSLIHP